MKRQQIAVVGSAGYEEYLYEKPDINMYSVAEELGKRLAENDCVVINGGKGGIMESVSKGAKRAGGITVAEVGGIKRKTSNKWVDVEVITGDIAFRGPSQLIAMSDVVVAIGGGAGTLQEICVAYRLKKPIVLIKGYGGWVDRLCAQRFLDERRLVEFCVVDNAKEAVEKASSLIK